MSKVELRNIVVKVREPLGKGLKVYRKKVLASGPLKFFFQFVLLLRFTIAKDITCRNSDEQLFVPIVLVVSLKFRLECVAPQKPEVHQS